MDDIRSYTKELLVGLNSTHEQGIMHRDVKPGNFLYNCKTKKGYLADYGLAKKSSTYQEVVEPSTSSTNRNRNIHNGPAGFYPHDSR